MRRALIAIAVASVLTVSALVEAFYVPRFGKAALDVAYNDYLNCRSDPPPSTPRRVNAYRHSEADCWGAYLDRREVIVWQYSLFQTLAKRLWRER